MKTMHVVKTCIAIGVLLITSGCAQLGPSTEQIKAMEGTSSSFCVESPGWNGSSVRVHYASYGGKSTGTAGGGGEAACGSSTVKFSNDGKQQVQK